MTETNSVKSLVGGEVKVLNDMKGSVTVSAWREQAERAAVRLCGETGRMMLHGTFPSIRATRAKRQCAHQDLTTEV